MEKHLATLADLEAEAANFLASLAPPERGATLVTLSGELGAGKTAFVQAAAKALGVEGSVASPTFVLMKVYALSGHRAWKRLAHIDAYRLTGGSELAALGFDELMSDAETLVMLEWPERVADALPPARAKITLAVAPDAARTIRYE